MWGLECGAPGEMAGEGRAFVVPGKEAKEGRAFGGIYKALGCFFFRSLFFIILYSSGFFIFELTE